MEYADLSGDETVWDMYCGIGTISLFLAQKAKKVYGVEIVPQAIDDARHNAEINGITNAEFFVARPRKSFPTYTKKAATVPMQTLLSWIHRERAAIRYFWTLWSTWHRSVSST